MKGLKRLLKMAEEIRKQAEPTQCKHCQSKHTVRYGHSKTTQRWLCRDCKHTFIEGNSPPRMKTPVEHIAAALNCYYSGMSLNAIRRHIDQLYGYRPSDSTVYEWLVRFSKKAVEDTKHLIPKVGDVWVADETALNIDGTHRYWLWDIIDAKTRFLLATHLSKRRTIGDARKLMELASKRADKVPKIILTDKLPSYLDGVELTFGADTKHIPIKGLRAEINTNIIERFHGTLKDRTKVMRGLKNKETAKLFIDGWLVHYNFFRPHESLKDITPSEKAGIRFEYNNWLDLAKKPAISPLKDKSPVIQKTPAFKEGIPKDVKRMLGMKQDIPKIFR